MIQPDTPVANPSIPDFTALFQERYEYCRLLQELSTQQASLIESGQYNDLVELLMKKQTVINALQSLINGPPSLFDQWKLHRDHIKPLSRTECDQLLEKTEAILKSLMESEDSSTSQLQSKRNETQRQISAVTQTVHVNQAYDQTAPACHIDLNR